MDRGIWWATVHTVTKELAMTEQLNNNKQILLLRFLNLNRILMISLIQVKLCYTDKAYDD